MPATRLETNVRRQPGVAFVDLTGEIDASAEESLTSAYAEATAADADAQTVVLNFTGVDYINSTGIALVVGLLAQARRDRVAVAACGLSDHYREIFEITRLSDFMQIFPDEESATGGLPAGSTEEVSR
jgi:anti-anti-sigma factor